MVKDARPRRLREAVGQEDGRAGVLGLGRGALRKNGPRVVQAAVAEQRVGQGRDEVGHEGQVRRVHALAAEERVPRVADAVGGEPFAWVEA